MNKFLAEILEQPIALEKTLNYYIDLEGKNALKNVKKAFIENDFEQIIFTGMGSSYFTSSAASSLFNSLNIPSFVINASELLHYNHSLLQKKTLLICFSQSGESFEIRELLKIVPASVFCIGISNEEDSTLAKSANIILLSKAGREDMTSTKSYVSATLVSFILGWSLADKWGENKINAINNLIENFRTNLTDYHSWVDKTIDFLGELPALSIIARGPGVSTAMQSGLMFKETTKIPAFGILGGEFRHGPMEMVQEGFKSILFAAKGKTLSQNIKMAEDIARFGGKVVVITNAETNLSHDKILVLPIEEQDEFLFSIQSIIPIQLFIDSYAKQRGFEAGSFAHGAKVTEVE
ncbi:Glucosamine-6-phosphate deaminase [isomerizing], alternative [hydrothermal vent metagenome]|uniref:Glucosamine-6-phosphate deaminase [isomerizing], alternative n=1 Tax=hydrothermal vent metagenome TaxID=652676 RepID=A0A3B0T3D3_9ZZZZ